jgi:hypothetical protein
MMGNLREWSLNLSFKRRLCYISGENLWFKIAYRGRKKVWSIIDNGRSINDDIWISQKEYFNMIRKGKLNV